MNSPTLPLAQTLAPPFGADQRTAIAHALRTGQVMTYPTETSYALGGNALSSPLVDQIYRLKGRDREKPMLLLVDARKSLRDWVGGISDAAQVLMERFWPGPLTLVFHAGPSLPFHLPDARGTVALRWSPNPVVQELLNIGGVPLIGTSANLSGRPSLHAAPDVLAEFPGEPILAVDGGPTQGGAPSTVLDVSVRPFRLVREGPVTGAAIREALGTRFADLFLPHA